MDTISSVPRCGGRPERPVPGVVGDDGVPLEVTIRGTRGPTVVFCHGFTVDSRFWAPQIAVVLVGHSMGGMSILSLARLRPEWFGTRIVGAFLVATSAGDLVREGPLGTAHDVARRLGVLPHLVAGARMAAPVADLLPWRASRLGRWTIRRLLFTAEAGDAEVRDAQTVSERLPLPVGQAFGASLLAFDESGALPVLARVPVVVVTAAQDRLTPAVHGRRITDAIGPSARLVEVEGAAHAVTVTHHAVVDTALLDLVHEVHPGGVARRGA